MATRRERLDLIAQDKTGGAFRSVQSNFQKLGGLARSFGLVFSGVIAARFAKDLIDLGDQMAKLSVKTGTSVEKLSAWSYGAELANVSTEQLAKGLVRLSFAMQDAAVNKTGDAAKSFRALGIEVTDAQGRLRSIDAVVEELADRFAGLPDGPEKTALAVRLLGRAGADLVPFLNSLRETNAEAQRTGRVIGTEFAKAAEEFNDTITRLKAGLQTFITSSEDSTSILNVLVVAMKSVASAAAFVASNLQSIGLGLGAIGAAAAATLSGNLDEAKRILALYDEDVARLGERLRKTYDAIWNPQPPTKPGGGKPTPPPPLVDFTKLDQLMQDLRKARGLAQAAITEDERTAALMRVQIAGAEFNEKARLAGLAFKNAEQLTAQERAFVEAYLDWFEAAVAQAYRATETPAQQLLRSWQNVTKQLQEATAAWLDGAADALTEWGITGKSTFRDFAESVIRDLVRIQIQKALAGFADDVGLGTLFGGGRAGGGPVAAGRGYLVGERGPELFVPGGAGAIVPTERLAAAAGPTIVVQQTNHFASGVTRAELAALLPRLREDTKAAVAESVSRGGRYSAAFRA